MRDLSTAATKKVVRIEERRAAEVEPEIVASPLYGVAMLKVAMELKRRDGADLDEILRGVLKTMRLPEADFREFLVKNGGLLKAIAERKRY